MTHNLATSRHPSGDGADKAADGIDLVAVIVFEKPSGQDLERLDLEPGLGENGAIVVDGDLRLDRLVMLVLDLADDFLDKVFNRDQPVNAAEFIDDQRQMPAPGRIS